MLLSYFVLVKPSSFDVSQSRDREQGNYTKIATTCELHARNYLSESPPVNLPMQHFLPFPCFCHGHTRPDQARHLSHFAELHPKGDATSLRQRTSEGHTALDRTTSRCHQPTGWNCSWLHVNIAFCIGESVTTDNATSLGPAREQHSHPRSRRRPYGDATYQPRGNGMATRGTGQDATTQVQHIAQRVKGSNEWHGYNRSARKVHF